MRESGDPVGHDVRPPEGEPLCASGAQANRESRVALWILAFARMTGGAYPGAYTPSTYLAYNPLCASRNAAFCTLPIALRGNSSTKITRLGVL